MNALKETESPAAGVVPSRFEEGGAMLLAGLKQRYTFQNMGEIPAQWGRFAPYIDQVPAKVGVPDYGVVVSTPEREGFDYMTAFPVSDTSGLPEGFTTLELPAQRYAVFPHAGHVSTLCQTIDAAFRQWLPQSGCQTTGNVDFLERYGENFDPIAGAGDLEIWLPIRH